VFRWRTLLRVALLNGVGLGPRDTTAKDDAMRSHVKLAVIAAVVAGGVLAAPAAASATNLWVSESPTVAGNGTSCTKPGFNKIQSAIGAAAAGSVVNICNGTYVEQLQVTETLTLRSVGTVTVQMPPAPQNSTTTCDTEIPENEYQRNQDLLSICTSGTVTITGLRFEAKFPAGTCYDSEYGIFAGGGATVKLSASTISDAGNPPPDPASGCQGGVGVQLGSARVTPNEVAHGVLNNDTVTNYQKNGIDVTGVGATGLISGTTVTGSGPTEHLAQNGIEVAFGGSAKIKTSSISGNECNEAGACGANPITETQSTGVLFFEAAAGSSVASSTISNSDIGVYYEDNEPTAPTKPQVLISGNKLNEDRYESVALGKGSATVTGNTITGGTVGIGLLQYKGEPYGVHGTGSKDNMSGLSSWAVNGFSDKEPTDQPGSFSITSSHISNNPPGAGVTESVHSESPTLTITTSATDT
jgi:Periplasmic copper-binding protein (NosD)